MLLEQLHGQWQLVLVLTCMYLLNNIAIAEAGPKRKYTLAEGNIQHAKENLPKQVYTGNTKLTRQVHNIYVDCLFDKFWEPSLPGLPYKWFSISGADDQSYGKCQLQ